jgi:hypothetical protein
MENIYYTDAEIKPENVVKFILKGAWPVTKFGVTICFDVLQLVLT